ncbi:carboxymuconolactone decarboxylase family protein [Chloroflexota bacterium]
MPENPLLPIATNDPELSKNLESCRELAFSDGALPKKVKFLIAIALDASKGSDGGVRSLAQDALKASATKQEIMEALRVAHFICGASSTYTAGRGLKDVF